MNAKVDISDAWIVTQRLILRPWRESDLADFYEYAKVDGVGQMAGWLPHKSIEESREILRSFIADRHTLALELRESGKVIGSLGLEQLRPDPVGGERTGREIGYVLSKDYWGRGLMPEAVKGVISYCFFEKKLDFLVCCHFLRNHRSRRVIEKSGFQYLRDGVYQTRYGTQEQTKIYILHNPMKISAPFSAAMVDLETPRLRLRPLAEEDWVSMYPSLADPEIADMIGWQPAESAQRAQEIVRGMVEGGETLAIELKEGNRFAGTLSVQQRRWSDYPIHQALRGREFGFDLKRDYWGRGLMPEAVNALCAYCFSSLHFDFVTCGHFLRNTRSQRVIEKCDFHFLTQKEQVLPTGVREEIATYIRYSPQNPRGEFHYV